MFLDLSCNLLGFRVRPSFRTRDPCSLDTIFFSNLARRSHAISEYSQCMMYGESILKRG